MLEGSKTMLIYPINLNYSEIWQFNENQNSKYLQVQHKSLQINLSGISFPNILNENPSNLSISEKIVHFHDRWSYIIHDWYYPMIDITPCFDHPIHQRMDSYIYILNKLGVKMNNDSNPLKEMSFRYFMYI